MRQVQHCVVSKNASWYQITADEEGKPAVFEVSKNASWYQITAAGGAPWLWSRVSKNASWYQITALEQDRLRVR